MGVMMADHVTLVGESRSRAGSDRRNRVGAEARRRCEPADVISARYGSSWIYRTPARGTSIGMGVGDRVWIWSPGLFIRMLYLAWTAVIIYVWRPFGISVLRSVRAE